MIMNTNQQIHFLTTNDRRTKHAFTLIEMLVVITVIATLIGIMLPVLKTVRDNAKKTKALTDIRKLELALQNYYNEYGHWPDTESPFKLDTMLNGNRDVLTGALWLPSYSDGAYFACNPRQIKFIEFDKASLDDSGYFIDPWGKTYKILLDNGQGYMGGYLTEAWNDPKANDGCVVDRQNQPLNRPIAIYSFGPNGVDDKALPNYDDITSWQR